MKNIFNSFGRLSRTAALMGCGILAFSSCSDMLDTKSDSLLDSSQTFSSIENTQGAVLGLYTDLCSDVYTQLMTIHQGTGTDVELIDGIGATSIGQNSERDGMNYHATTSWAKLGTLWEEQYATIEDCNRIIDGINEYGQNTDEFVKCSSEARVIRAMVYLDLIRVFGDVPFMWHKAQSDLSNTNITKTDRDVILDSLINDLKWVVGKDKLPWVGATTSEHVNMGYAKGLLANICMTRAGYAIREDGSDEMGYAKAGGYDAQTKKNNGYIKAAYSDDKYLTLRPSDEKCKELYTEAKNQLQDIYAKGVHKMNPSFVNEWYLINQLVLDNQYKENMFEIPVGLGNAGELGYTVGVRMNTTTSTIDWGNYNSSGKVKTTAVQLYSYQPTDTRRDVTCIAFEFKDLDRSSYITSNMKEGNDTVMTPVKATINSLVKNKPFGLYIGKWDVRKMSNQWYQQNKNASSKFGYGINTVRMRYPQILLWLAECKSYLGDYTSPSPQQLIKDVHHRGLGTYGGRVINYHSWECTICGNISDDTNCPTNCSVCKKENTFRKLYTAYTGRKVEDDKAAFDTKVDNAGSNYEKILELIDEENKLEFCGENFRKWDLIRWNRLHDDINAAKEKYIELKNGEVFQDKVYFKYVGYKECTDETTGVNYYSAPEKVIDWSSATWYGKDGTNTVKGNACDATFFNDNGYRYAKEKGYTYPGFGDQYKGINNDSYVFNSFKQDVGGTYNTDFPSICSGLVGYCDPNTGKVTTESLEVKNRYLMPIYSNVVSSSLDSNQKARIYNSYGY